MARPIEPTPRLEGADAEAFLASMSQGVPLSPQRLQQASEFVAEVAQGKALPVMLKLSPRR